MGVREVLSITFGAIMRKWLAKFVLIKNRKLFLFVFVNGSLVAKFSL